MQRRGPIARTPHYAPVTAAVPPVQRADLDAMAYGQRAVYPPQQAAPVVAVAPPVPMAPPPVITAPPPPAFVAPRPVVAAPSPIAATRPGLLTNILGRKPRPVMTTGSVPIARQAIAPVILHDPAYRLDAGDRLRIVVFGQEGLSNSYAVDAAGAITMPLIGTVPARGCTPAELAAAVTSRLQNGFIREPYVAVEIEAYRPFFILGEVAAPGQYPFVPNMTAESAVAIAGGFTPRAKRNVVTIVRSNQMGQTRIVASPNAPLSPGDTITIGERWF